MNFDKLPQKGFIFLKKQLVIHSTQHNQKGGAALEYILVSSFALVLTLSALGFIGNAIKNKISEMEEKLGSSLEIPFLDNNPLPK
tara:strand:+ start:94 stop:348 length:255 start_codon:yes stop_codon:yes gene_type:complete